MKVLPELTELGIDRTIPFDWGLPKLVEARFPKLRIMDLGRKSIGEAGALALAEGIAKGHFDALARMALGGNPIPESAAVKILQAMSTSNMQLDLVLDFNDIPLGADFCEALGSFWASPAAIKLCEYSLVNTGFGDAEAAILAKALVPGVLPKLYFIEFGKNSQIGEEGKSALNEAARVHRESNVDHKGRPKCQSKILFS